MKTITYKTARIKLRWCVDASEPTLAVEIIKGLGRDLRRVRVTTEHPVWRGAELTNRHFKVLEVDDDRP
jgi:hypothetical protein